MAQDVNGIDLVEGKTYTAIDTGTSKEYTGVYTGCWGTANSMMAFMELITASGYVRIESKCFKVL